MIGRIVFCACLLVVAAAAAGVLWNESDNWPHNPPYTVEYIGDFGDSEPVENGVTKRSANTTGRVKVKDKDGNVVQDRTVQMGDEVIECTDPANPTSGIQYVCGHRPGG